MEGMKPAPTKLTKEIVRELLDYHPDTGAFYWKQRPPSYFRSKNEAHSRSWNKNWAGKEALTAQCVGYRVGYVLWNQVRAHRVAWLWMTGRMPTNIDHINGDRSDNRWENLREVTPLENQRNRKMNRNNNSGKPGVCWAKGTQKWQAQIKNKGKMIYLGQYKRLEDAIRAREEAEVSLGFMSRESSVFTSA